MPFIDAAVAAQLVGATVRLASLRGSAVLVLMFFGSCRSACPVLLTDIARLDAATLEGREQDPAIGYQAKQRSIHNNYFTFPLLFIMISNHFPSTYGHHLKWLILFAVMIGGAAAKAGATAGYLRVPPALPSLPAAPACTRCCQACHSSARSPKRTTLPACSVASSVCSCWLKRARSALGTAVGVTRRRFMSVGRRPCCTSAWTRGSCIGSVCSGCSPSSSSGRNWLMSTRSSKRRKA